MKHITPILTLAFLTAASASAQVSSAKKSGINYNRVSLEYASNDAADAFGISATADIGGGVILGGGFTDLSIDNSDADGRGVGASIGFAQPVGAGSVYVGVGYQQLWAGGYDGAGVAEATVYTLGYRHTISPSIELGAVVNHMKYSGVSTDGESLYLSDNEDDTQWGLSARFFVTKQVDITVGYLFAEEDTWSIAVGYNF